MSRFRIRHDGRELTLGHGTYVIGRSSSCSLVLDGALVSRRHAQLRVGPDGVTVEDLGSRNGTRVDGQRIDEPRPLHHGDVIHIGTQTIRVLQEELLHRAEMLSTLPPPDQEERSRSGEQTVTTEIVQQLSKREYEVFELLVQGFTQREIAERLYVSVKTVESHSRNIRLKLACDTRAELVRYAIVAGLLAPGSESEPREGTG